MPLNCSEYQRENDGTAEPVGWWKFGEAISPRRAPAIALPAFPQLAFLVTSIATIEPRLRS